MLSYKFQLLPNNDQVAKLWLHANKCNFLYNYFLNQRIENFKNNIKTTQYQQQAELIFLKEKDPILKEIHSQVLQQVTLRLQNSYTNFFKRISRKEKQKGFPKFRSCHNFFSLCYPQSGFSIKNNILTTKAYGNIEFNCHRNILGNIIQIRILNKNNKFYICITTDYNVKNKKSKLEIGIDIGLKDLVVATDGTKISNCSHAKYYDKKISELQGLRDKVTKYKSRRYKRYSVKINRLYELKNRKIDDFQHKVSRKLANKYDIIYVEDLSVKKMSESNKTGLNKSVRNSKLSQIVKFLEYKVRKVVLVNPINTSKTCNICGKIHKDLKLSDRKITCSCGARNIFDLGKAIDGLDADPNELDKPSLRITINDIKLYNYYTVDIIDERKLLGTSYLEYESILGNLILLSGSPCL